MFQQYKGIKTKLKPAASYQTKQKQTHTHTHAQKSCDKTKRNKTILNSLSHSQHHLNSK